VAKRLRRRRVGVSKQFAMVAVLAQSSGVCSLISVEHYPNRLTNPARNRDAC
jgi:hypothetical protein